MFEFHELIKAVCGRRTGPAPQRPITGISIDTRTIKPQDAFIAIRGENFDGHCFINEAVKKGASCIVVQAAPDERAKDAPPACFVEVDNTIKALGDIAAAWRKKFDIPVIAVTGSNGKTTTKEMTARVLSARFKVLKSEGTENNHIGVPMGLLGLRPGHEAAVLELGSNHPGEIAYLSRICSPTIGIITNVGESHLEGFRDLKGVLREKSSLLEHLSGPRIAIINADNAFLSKLSARRTRGAAVFTYGAGVAADFTARCFVKGRCLRFTVNEKNNFRLKTPGAFNACNALAAIAAGRLLGLEFPQISKQLSGFVFPKGRLNVMDLRAVRVIDDTYNSNPISLEQALLALARISTEGRKIFVMGDMLELGERREFFHDRAGSAVARVCDTFIGVGELSRKTAASAGRAGLKDVFTCAGAAEARDILFNKVRARRGDVVLVKGSRSMKMEEVFRRG